MTGPTVRDELRARYRDAAGVVHMKQSANGCVNCERRWADHERPAPIYCTGGCDACRAYADELGVPLIVPDPPALAREDERLRAERDALAEDEQACHEQLLDLYRLIVSYADLTHEVVTEGRDWREIADEWGRVVAEARAALDSEPSR